VTYQRKDSYYYKAKQAGYRSRAAYKLIELQERFKLIKKGMQVIDLGCAPGGWLQVAAKYVGSSGCLVGVDRLEVPALDFKQVKILKGDVSDAATIDELLASLNRPADLLLSDMAPDTSGVGFADHARSLELVEIAGDLAKQLLKPVGGLVAKAFDGPDLNELIMRIKDSFEEVKRLKLKSTRKGSRELYLIARGHKA
jgi:23S rRNA (uridine2552-2'-O)-methyltransferase